ncbi:MAG: beta-galactosidase [Verrucomicrobiota bacterium]|nr:beta-galactosidase [Verrucomicrobiota bacterium]
MQTSSKPHFISIDLSPVANRAHRATALGQAPVWEGDPLNALDTLPSGQLTFDSIPYVVLDPERQTSGSIVALHPNNQDGLPATVSIALPQSFPVAKLHILIASGSAAHGREVGSAALYEGTVQCARLPFVAGQNTGNWWWPETLPGANLAWIGENPRCLRVGFHHISWSVDNAGQLVPNRLVLTTTSPRLYVIAITAESVSADCIAVPEGRVAPDPQRYTRLGGWRSRSLRATGRFYTAQMDGRWWLVDPEGHCFLSKGVNEIRINTDPSPALGGRMLYQENVLRELGNAAAWRARTQARLSDWNINTVGEYSDPAFHATYPHYRILECATRAGANWFGRKLCDVWSTAFSDACRQAAHIECTAGKNDPLLIGYFIDNEMPFVKGADSVEHILTQYLRLPADAAGRVQTTTLLRNWYGDNVEALNLAWNTAYADFSAIEPPLTENANYAADADRFACEIMLRYCEVSTTEIRKVDPDHLIIGCRFAYINRRMKEVLEIAARYFDVISFNHYRENPIEEGMEMLRELCQRHGKPALITEFGFRGDDVGLPNTHGAGQRVPTQFDKAWSTGRYLERAFAQPHIIGCNLWKWNDQPPTGRFDGENSNYGLVTIRDEIYPDMTRTIRRLFGEAELRHATGFAD